MYDRRLDAIVAAAELGSFSRAAERAGDSADVALKLEPVAHICFLSLCARGCGRASLCGDSPIH